MKINVPELSKDLGKRLDLYLSLNLPKYSRSFIKKTIESNKVLVNGEVCYKAGYKIQPNDVIEFPDIEFSAPSLNLKPSVFDLEIVHEDDDYLIINKPIGLTVHPTDSSQEDTLVNKLLARYQELPTNEISRPGIVHRLDKDTSGLIAVAKSSRGLWWLSQQFADRKVEKKYLSIGLIEYGASKVLNSPEFEIQGQMIRNTVNRKEFTLLEKDQTKDNSRFSLTKFKVLEKIEIGDNKTLIYLECSPKTGRTHQIRVHQKSFRAPILGDSIYLPRKQKMWSDNFLESNNLENRLYLHSYSLTFENYDGKMYSFKTEVPKSFEDVLNYAKKSSTK